MYNTLSLSRPAAAGPNLPAGDDARAPNVYDRLCALDEPDQLHSIEVHGFAGTTSPGKIDSMMEAVGRRLADRCNVPADRIQRIAHRQPDAYPAALYDKVLVDVRHASRPEAPRLAIFAGTGPAAGAREGQHSN
ncbi:hypothetical protein CAL29_28470 [Bordetella genomosp. 10]|uniref:Uncharacterized protein n=1 Tax=Bordetella genomosp. 10 TaxID=1416804 RepID=A0A261S5U5_9BORD|nr:hypothetical protein [Bordetella genomosp. 10]OZI31803.1 hypothetical protein CAL29_28470 [Bordetella genomosp. 10]